MNKLENGMLTLSRSLWAVALSLVTCLPVLAESTVDGESFNVPDGLYSAEYLDQRNGITVIEFTGSYDRELSDGSTNAAARAVVAREFYQHNPDNYDFLVVFSDFEFETGDAQAFHLGVSNSVEGIGLPIYSNADLFGSAESLLGYIDMAALSRYETNPLVVSSAGQQTSFDSALKVLGHETLHQWAAHTDIDDFQGRDDGHWSFFLDTDASLEYGHDWRDNGDGTFTAESARTGFSKLDLYLMGLLDRSEVPDTFVIQPHNDDYLNSDLPKPGITINGIRKNYSMDDFVAVHGERVPNVVESPKVLRYGFIYLVPPGQPVSSAELAKVNVIREAYQERFSILTGGRAIARVFPSTEVHTEPGSYEIVSSDDEVSPSGISLANGISWLKSQQRPDGNWQDKPATDMRDTHVAVTALDNLDQQATLPSALVAWLRVKSHTNVDSLARSVSFLSSGFDLPLEQVDDLLTQQRLDGGWGLNDGFDSNVLDTALSICPLSSLPRAADAVLSGADYLYSQQNMDGGWGATEKAASSVSTTTHVLRALRCAKQVRPVTENALTWLRSKSNIDNGFGDQGSSVHETALVLLAFLEFEASSEIPFASAAEFIAARQGVNGDWGGSVYATALALQAVKSSSFANLKITSLSPQQAEIKDGDLVEFSALLSNDSADPALASVAKFYHGEPDDGGVEFASVNVPTLPPFSSVTISGYWSSFNASGTQKIVVIADADQELIERSELDNKFVVDVLVAPPAEGVELLLSSTEFLLDPERLTTLPAVLEFSATVRNIGDANAPQVTLQLWQGTPENNGSLLETRTVSLDSRSSTGVNFQLLHTVPGTSEFVLIADPENRYVESDESNNRAVVSVASEDGIDLEVTAADISVENTSVYLNQNVDFSVTIRNNGTVSTPNARVDFLILNAQGEEIIQSQQLILAPAETVSISASWIASFSGESTFLVRLDADNMIAEVDETNNVASIGVEASLAQGSNLSLNYNELVFNPNPGLEGMGATLSAVIRNSGTQDIAATKLNFYDGDPNSGGSLIGTQNVANLLSGQAQNVQIIWPSIPSDQSRFIYVLADPEAELTELDETDNVAFAKFEVLSLPDIAISSESIQATPKFPRVNQAALFTIKLTNRGKQMVPDVSVKAFSGSDASGVEIASTLLDIPGSGDQEWQFEHTFSSVGDGSLFVSVDSDNLIVESNESNNTARKEYSIQDGDFYVSDLYLSPNGNGLKESVQYFFNLPEPDVVSVVLIDQYDREVAELAVSNQAVQSESVSWDGSNKLGGVVADGTYVFAVKNGSGQYLGQRSVILDTDRSPLSDAIGTPYALSRNLTCRIGEVHATYSGDDVHLPDTQNILYGPNDQFIYFTTYFEPYEDDDDNLIRTDEYVLYPSGLYRALNDGSDVTQLVADDDISVRNIVSYNVSPDGSKLVVLTRDGLDYRLWAVATDGSGIVELSSPSDMTVPGTDEVNFVEAQYINDTEILLLDKSNFYRGSSKLWTVVDVPGATASMIFDSSILALSESVSTVELNPQKTHALIKFSGDGYPVFVSYDLFNQPLDYSIVLLDLSAAGSAVIVDTVSDHSWSPTGQTFIVGKPDAGVLRLYDTQGAIVQTITMPDFQSEQFSQQEQSELRDYFGSLGFDVSVFTGLSGNITDITWNPDATEFAFVFEDYIAAFIKSDGCSIQQDEPAFIFDAGVKAAFSAILNTVISTADAGIEIGGNNDGCINVPPSIRSLLEKYQAKDGIYVADIEKSSITLAAKTSSINASFEGFTLYRDSITEYLQDLPEVRRASQNELGVRSNPFGVPITPDGYPYIEWAGPSWAIGLDHEGVLNESRRTLTWLDGARELLVSNGDELQHYDRSNERLYGRSIDPQGEVIPARFRRSNNSVVINLDDSANDSAELFSNRDFTLVQSSWHKRGAYPTNTGKFISMLTEDRQDMCLSNDVEQGYRQFQSLLNLTADLRVRKSASLGGFLLEGTATDKHFDYYLLEYADVATPDNWVSIAPASDLEVIEDRFTTWVPPAIGNYYVRLSVYDLAGNVRQEVTQVSNRERPSISGVYLSEPYFSPNGDAVKDETVLHFKVLEPVNLQVTVLNEFGAIVRTLTRSFDVIGAEETIEWNGRDDHGQLAVDGKYRVQVQRYEFFTTLDNTAPVIRDLTKPVFVPIARPQTEAKCEYPQNTVLSPSAWTELSSCLVTLDLAAKGTVVENALDTFILQSKLDTEVIWQDQTDADSVRIDEESGLPVLRHSSDIDSWRSKQFRYIAHDLAGNRSVLSVEPKKRDRVHILSYADSGGVIANRFGYGSHVGFGRAEGYRAFWPNSATAFKIALQHTASAPIQFVELMYKEANSVNDFASTSIELLPRDVADGGGFEFEYDLAKLTEVSAQQIEIQVRLTLEDGRQIVSDAVEVGANLNLYVMPELECDQLGCGAGRPNSLAPNANVDFGTNISADSIDRVVFLVKSIGSKVDLRFQADDTLTVTNEQTFADGTVQLESIELTGYGVKIADTTDPFTRAGVPGQTILPFSDSNLNLVAECGYGYRLTALVFHHGSAIPKQEQFSDSAPCINIDVDVDPVKAQQCDARPTDLVDVYLKIALDSENGGDANTLTPLFVQLGLPHSDVTQADQLESVLYSQNLPILGQVYSFQLDTTPFVEGDLKLRVVLALESGERIVKSFIVPVVHTAAQVRITYPQENQRICATEYYQLAPNDDQIERGVALQGDISSSGPDIEMTIGGDGFAGGGLSDGSRVGYLGQIGIIDSISSNTVGRTRRSKNDPVSFTGRVRVADNQLVRHEPIRYSPITKQVTSAGVLGILTLSNSDTFEFTLEALNWSGARVCTAVTAEVDAEIEGLAVNLFGTKEVEHPPHNDRVYDFISPNDDDFFDVAEIDLTVDEAISLNVEVYATEYQRDVDGSEEYADLGLVAQPYIDQTLLAGSHELDWSGTDDSGAVLPDGIYRVSISARDGCGNTDTTEFLIGVDTSPPTLAITYPEDGSDIPIQIRILGEISDLHPSTYQLSISRDGAAYNLLASGTGNIIGALGQWDSFGQTGTRILRLTAHDALGNTQQVEHSFTVPERQNIVSSLETSEYFVSPNGDGRFDALTIRVGVDVEVLASLSIIDQDGTVVRRIAQGQTFGVGYSTLIWDGLDLHGDVPVDGLYRVELSAAEGGQIQTELVAFELDNTSPSITLDNLLEGYVELLGGNQINGQVADKNSLGYTLSLLSPSTAQGDGLLLEPLEIGVGDSNKVGVLAQLPDELFEFEQEYDLTVLARDAAGNHRQLASKVTVDRIPPKVRIDQPVPNQAFNLASSPIELVGLVEDRFLRHYRVEVAPTATPELITEIGVEGENADGLLATWDLNGVVDGDYLISIIARDKAGLETRQQIPVAIDNQAPDLALLQPSQNGYLTELLPIRGSANDAHFEQYSLALAGEHGDDLVFANLITSNLAVSADTLVHLPELPSDGLYTFKLTASDTAGNTATILHPFTVDTQPPAAPILTSLAHGSDPLQTVSQWQANTESDLAGYNLYRNGDRVNTGLLSDLQYVDSDLPEGTYTYTLRAVDLAGQESETSNPLEIRVDITPPATVLATPQNGTRVNQLVDIIGTAHSTDDFKLYKLFAGPIDGAMTLVRESMVPIRADLLAQWDTFGLVEDSDYLIRLEAQDNSGNVSAAQSVVTVDNTAPNAPVNLTAMLENTADARLRWEFPSAESDLFGFLLYRNGRLANTSEPVIGDLRPYAIHAIEYLDAALNDGEHEYVVYALDQAGNQSQASNTAELSIDNRAPAAHITSVEDGHAFDGSLFLLAESEDSDIASIVFQYRASGDINWIDIAVEQSAPYQHQWNTDAVVYGDYQIRAVATDLGGKVDLAPAIKAVTKRDVDPPAAVINGSINVDGSTATLTWEANQDTDLAGYHVYRGDCADCEIDQITDLLVTTTTLQDIIAEDGDYFYQISAVDLSGNVSPRSEILQGIFATTRVSVSPFFSANATAQLDVGLASDDLSFDRAQVEILSPTGLLSNSQPTSGSEETVLQTNISMQEIGIFDLSVAAQSTRQNFSARPAHAQVINVGIPSVPAGVEAQFDAADYDIDVSWLANPVDEKVKSYRVVRDGIVIGENQRIEDATAQASHGNNANNFLPQSSYSGYWSVSGAADVRFGQSWAKPRLVSQVQLAWTRYYYAALEVSVFALVDGEWVQVATNTKSRYLSNTTISLAHRVPTTAIEVRVDRWYSSFNTGRLYQMRVMADELFNTTELFSDQPDDGVYQYQVAAVNNYGGISDLSDPAELAYGDTEPPLPVILDVSVQDADIALDWSTVTDAASYRIYQNGELLQSIGGNSLQLVDYANGTYQFFVTAVDAVGNESEASNEVEAIVNQPLPAAPVNLTAYADNDGPAIWLDWEVTDTASLSHYNIYYVDNFDGEYYQFDTADDEYYDDYDVEPGEEYFYRVTAVDEFGNESAPSNIASARLDIPLLYAKPTISAPTDATQPITLVEPTVTVAGLAQPGSLVYLLHQDEFLVEPVQTDSYTNVDRMGYSINDELVDFDFSDPDAPLAIWYEGVANETSVVVLQAGEWRPLSKDGLLDSIDFEFVRRLTKTKVLLARGRYGPWFVFDASDETLKQIDIEQYPDYYVNSILGFSDEHQIAVVEAYVEGTGSDVYKLDIATKTLSALPPHFDLNVSPSGRFMAYTPPVMNTPAQLIVRDLVSGTEQMLELPDANQFNLLEHQQPWSADESKIILTGGANSEGDTHAVFNHVDNQLVVIAQDEFDVIQTAWSSADSVLVVADNGDTGDVELYTFLLSTGAFSFIEYWSDFVSDDANLLGISSDRNIYVLDDNDLEIMQLAGRFSFADVALVNGANSFSAVSVNSAQEISDPADIVTVTYAPNPLPDYQVAVRVNPQIPLLDKNADIQLTLSNTGTNVADTAVLQLQVIRPDGEQHVLLEQMVGPVAADSSLLIDIPWVPNVAGEHTLIANIDLDEQVVESLEDNNTQIQLLQVAQSAAPSLAVSVLNSSQGNLSFGIPEALSGVVQITNPGETFNGDLELSIVDENDELVVVIDLASIVDLPYAGQVSVPVDWNTRSVVPGSYQLRARLIDASQTEVVRSSVSFEVFEALHLVLGVAANQASFAASEDVQLAVTLLNRSQNAILQSGDLQVRVLAPNGDVLSEQRQGISQLLATDRLVSAFNWNTELHPPGHYQAIVNLFDGTEELATSTLNFEIRLSAVSAFEGRLTLPDNELVAGQALVFASELSNRGNTVVANIGIEYRVVDSTNTLRSSFDSVALLPVGGNRITDQSIGTQNLTAGRYRLLLIATTATGETRTLDDTGFVILESSPPVVSISQPSEGSVINGQKVQALMSAQDESGVDSIELKFAGGDWFRASSSGLDRTAYYASLTSLVDGQHSISARATDLRGNTSNPISRQFVVDNTAPQIEVLNIVEGATMDVALVPEVLVVDANLRDWSATLNGQPWQSGESVDQTGDYHLVINAYDLAGNTQRMTRDFSLDLTVSPPLGVVAADDVLNMRRGVWGTVYVLLNDQFPNLADLQLDVVSQPQHGSLVEASTGRYNYYPGLLYLGSDRFTYRITDKKSGASSLASVAIDVGPAVSCSIVPDHATTIEGVVSLPEWATTAGDTQVIPRYMITVLGTSDDSAFVPGQTPQVSFPNCDLIYTPRANIRREVTVSYRVTDVASNGDRYTSPVREFTLNIDNRDPSKTTVVPLLKLLLLDESE